MERARERRFKTIWGPLAWTNYSDTEANYKGQKP